MNISIDHGQNLQRLCKSNVRRRKLGRVWKESQQNDKAKDLVWLIHLTASWATFRTVFDYPRMLEDLCKGETVLGFMLKELRAMRLD